jgi:hypothetical protein
MGEDKRDNRSSESREAEMRDQVWKPQSMLPMDFDFPEGIEGRWVRTKFRDQDDIMNVSHALREGWIPVPASDFPNSNILPDLSSKFEGNIEVGGLLLCKRAKSIGDQARAYYRQKGLDEMKGIDDALMSQASPQMPILKPSRQTQVDVGPRPTVDTSGD